jgi:hypothetical protein
MKGFESSNLGKAKEKKRNDMSALNPDIPAADSTVSMQFPELPSAAKLLFKKRKTGPNTLSPKRLKTNDGTAEMVTPSADDESRGMKKIGVETIDGKGLFRGRYGYSIQGDCRTGARHKDSSSFSTHQLDCRPVIRVSFGS